VGSGGCAGSGARRPSQLRSFAAINMPPPGISQPKAVFGKLFFFYFSPAIFRR
jgi:hypothetical protein